MASRTARETGGKRGGERSAPQLGILGQAGCVEDGLGFSAGMFAKMLDIVPLAMRHAFGVDIDSEAASRMTLASAGAAFGDHVAVVLWLRSTLETDFCEDDADDDAANSAASIEPHGAIDSKSTATAPPPTPTPTPATIDVDEQKTRVAEGGSGGGGGTDVRRREPRGGLGFGQLRLHTPGVFRDGAYQSLDSSEMSSSSSASSSSSSLLPSSTTAVRHRTPSAPSSTLVAPSSKPAQMPQPAVGFPQAPFHNTFHASFSRAIRRDTLGDLESARLLGAIMRAVSGGRRAGCERVAADSTHLIVFSWGESPDAPDPGVLRDAWNRCGGRHKLHLRLSKLDLDLHRFTELEASRHVAISKRASTELAAARLARRRVRTS